jgi:hypothetical protein
MTSRHANRYAARAAQAARAADAANELTPAAYACLLSPPDAMPAPVFRELLEKEYLQAAKRGWRWTAKAEAVRARA